MKKPFQILQKEIAKQYNVKAIGVVGSVADETDVKELFKKIYSNDSNKYKRL